MVKVPKVGAAQDLSDACAVRKQGLIDLAGREIAGATAVQSKLIARMARQFERKLTNFGPSVQETERRKMGQTALTPFQRSESVQGQADPLSPAGIIPEFEWQAEMWATKVNIGR